MRRLQLIAGLAFGAFALFAALGFIGASEFRDEIRADVHYCDMVADGHWGAYRPELDCVGVYKLAARELGGLYATP